MQLEKFITKCISVKHVKQFLYVMRRGFEGCASVINGKGVLWEIDSFLDAKNAAKHFQLRLKKVRAQSGVPKKIRYENRIFYFLPFLSGQIVAKARALEPVFHIFTPVPFLSLRLSLNLRLEAHKGNPRQASTSGAQRAFTARSRS